LGDVVPTNAGGDDGDATAATVEGVANDNAALTVSIDGEFDGLALPGEVRQLGADLRRNGYGRENRDGSAAGAIEFEQCMLASALDLHADGVPTLFEVQPGGDYLNA